MFAYPALEIRAEVTEVRRLVHARGETIERDKQVCSELSHGDSSNMQGQHPIDLVDVSWVGGLIERNFRAEADSFATPIRRVRIQAAGGGLW